MTRANLEAIIDRERAFLERANAVHQIARSSIDREKKVAKLSALGLSDVEVRAALLPDHHGSYSVRAREVADAWTRIKRVEGELANSLEVAT